MSSTKVAHGMGVAVASGLAASGALALVFFVVGLPLGDYIYPFVGGIITGRILRRSKRAGAYAGALSAFFSFPVLLFLFFGLLTAGIYEAPTVPPEDPAGVLVQTLGFVAFQTILGALGGALSSTPSRRHPEIGAAPAWTEALPAKARKSCIQCGAQLDLAAEYCYACAAKQPAGTER